MPSAPLSSGLCGGFTQVSEDSLLKQKIRNRHKRNRRLRRSFARSIKLAVTVLCLAFMVKGTLVEAFFVPSGSMTPTLKTHDYILVEKLRYGLRVPFIDTTIVPWHRPDRGDVVVFKRTDSPRTAQDESEGTLVKRVVGVGGDVVVIQGTQVFVNGELLYEPYADWGTLSQHVPLTFLVPEGALFVLGDNRANSFDSRAWDDPFVAEEQVVGKAAVVYWNGTSSPS